jgi:hypothetical protein
MRKVITWIITITSGVLWILDRIGAFQTAQGLVQNRTRALSVLAAVTASQWIPLTIFICGVIALFSLSFGSDFWKGIVWWIAPSKGGPVRGDLHLTVLSFDYDDGYLVSHLMFHNNDSFERTVLGVNFLYRSNKSHKGFEVYNSGPRSAPFIGHIDPVKIAPKGEETRRYAAKLTPERFLVDGAEAGLSITFTAPGYGDDSATIVAMQMEKTGDLSIPSQKFPNIKNLSLDSIAHSREVERLIRGFKASQEPKGFPKYIAYGARFFDY